MIAIKFSECNVIIAENQKEYLPLPAYVQNNGLSTFCFELSNKEAIKVKRDRYINFTFLTFGRPLQPVYVSTIKPLLPVKPESMSFVCNPKTWYASPGNPAMVQTRLCDSELKQLNKTSQIWITISTFGAPLQPISTEII